MSKQPCKHTKLNLLHIDWEYPKGISGTSTPLQYAYFTCRSCGDCIKKEVKVV